MKKISILMMLILSIMYYGQIKIEKGYFIDNNDVKSKVLIKNEDWKNNPTSFQFKTTENGQFSTKTISEIKEFGIDNDVKFVKKTVQIDRSSENIKYLSKKKDPEFNEEILFLKVLIEGKANLYYYEDANFRRFFYNLDKTENPKQLVYKTYMLDNHSLAKNKEFQEQLKNELACSPVSENQLNSIEYVKNDLIQYFKDYNECLGQDASVYKKTRKNDFNLNIRPGINFSSLDMSFRNNRYELESKMNFRIGLELEYIFPFNRNKWAAFIEPTYQSYDDDLTYTLYSGTVFEEENTINVNYSSIEVPVGLRYYMFLNSNSKFFADLSYILDFQNKSSKIESINGETFDITTSNNLGFGIGFQYKKLIVEGKILTKRNLFSEFGDGDYYTTSLILGYNIF